jgi:hypothetical protein
MWIGGWKMKRASIVTPCCGRGAVVVEMKPPLNRRGQQRYPGVTLYRCEYCRAKVTINPKSGKFVVFKPAVLSPLAMLKRLFGA